MQPDLNASREGAFTVSLGNLFQCLITFAGKNFYLIPSSNLLSSSLKPLPLILSLPVLIKSPSPGFCMLSSGTIRYMVPQEPSLLQAEKPQLSQPVLIGEVLQPCDHLCGPPLDLLQHLHVLPVLGEMYTTFSCHTLVLLKVKARSLFPTKLSPFSFTRTQMIHV